MQVSAGSQTPAEARHSVVGGSKRSDGQGSFTPSQLSATSHGPAGGRHTVPAGVLASAGQVVLVPVHVSCGSQAPPDPRQSAPALPAGCWQALLVPSHWSTVQGLASLVHAVPDGCFASAGQLPLVPLQVSATSQTSAAARQVVPAALNVQLVVQHEPAVPLAAP